MRIFYYYDKISLLESGKNIVFIHRFKKSYLLYILNVLNTINTFNRTSLTVFRLDFNAATWIKVFIKRYIFLNDLLDHKSANQCSLKLISAHLLKLIVIN